MALVWSSYRSEGSGEGWEGGLLLGFWVKVLQESHQASAASCIVLAAIVWSLVARELGVRLRL